MKVKLAIFLVVGQFELDQEKQRQTCKVCGRRDKFNFHISDKTWKTIVPFKYRTLVVCLACFDYFAYKKKIKYANSIKILNFAGDKAVFLFGVRKAKNL